MHITINTNIAVEYNINSAIFLQQLAQWTFRNLANNHHIHDGHVWSFNSLEAYEKIFPFWNSRQLQTVISNLLKEGLILKGNYNKHKYDRTCWYALTYKALIFFPELMKPEFLDSMLGTISQNCEMETPDFGNNNIVELHFTKMLNGVHENVTPIPTYTQPKDISKDISVELPKNVNEKELKTKPKTLGLRELKADNPHNISESMLEDWLEVRKSKKSPVTKTAWNKINKTLTSIRLETGIKPQEAFETMVSNGWQSFEVKYFQDNKSASNKSEGAVIRDYSGNIIYGE